MDSHSERTLAPSHRESDIRYASKESLLDKNDRASSRFSEGGEHKDQAKQSSFTTTIFSIVNTAIGGGILGYPYIMRQLGLVAGSLLIILGALLTCFSSVILLQLKNLTKKSDYLDIAYSCFKTRGHKLASLIIVVNTLGGCTIYLLVFATVVQNILAAFVPACEGLDNADPIYCRTPFLTASGALIILPFNFMKSFEKLKFVSILKSLSVLTFTLITIVFAISKAAKGELASDFSFGPNIAEPVSMLATIPQIIFGFNFLYNMFSFYNTMKDDTDKKFTKATAISISFIGFTYLCIGICGYLIYGSITDNMLENFKKRDLGPVWFTIQNVAFLICSLGGIPVTFFPARDIICDNIQKLLEKKKVRNSHSIEDNENINGVDGERQHKEPKKNKTVFISVVLIATVLVTLVAIYAPNLNQVLGLIGSIGSAGLMFLFPMSFYLKKAPKKQKRRILVISVLVFGVLVGISGFSTNLIKIING